MADNQGFTVKPIKLDKPLRMETTVTFNIIVECTWRFRLRFYLAKQSIKLACWLLNSGVEFANQT